MNDNEIDQSKDSSSLESSGDPQLSPKRQKLEESNSTSLSTTDNDSVLEPEGECRLLKTKLETLRARLFQTEVTASDLYEIRRENDKIFKRDESVLQMLLKVNAEGIEQLRRELEAAMRSNYERLEALITAESNMTQMKIALERKIVALLAENYQLETRTISCNSEEDSGSEKSQEDDREARKQMVSAAERKIVELESQLEDNLLAQTDYDLQNMELEQAQRTIRELQTVDKRRIELESRSMSQNGFNCQQMKPGNPNNELERSPAEPTSANDSEEQLQSFKNVISIPHEAVEGKVLSEEQMSTLQKLLDEAEEAQQVMRLEEKFEELASKLYSQQSSNSGTSSVASKQEVYGPQHTEAVSLAERENLRFQIDYHDPRQPHFVSMENEYFNPADNDFPWYVPDDDGGLPVQNIDRVRFGYDNGYRNNDAGMIGPVPDWLLTPEASWSAVSNEDSASNEPDENGCSNSDTESAGSYLSNDSHLLEIEEEKDPLDALKLMVGKNLILVSNPKFFEIKWNDECEQIEGNKWICKKCEHSERWRPRMEDHVWITHYKEIFKCAYCPFTDEKNHYKSRSFARGHFKSKHPDLHEEMEQKPKKNKPNV